MTIVPICPICDGKMLMLRHNPMQDSDGKPLLDRPAESVEYGCSDCGVRTIMPNQDLSKPVAYTHLTSELRVGMLVRRKDDDAWHTIEHIFQEEPISIQFAGAAYRFNPSSSYADSLRWAIAQEDITPNIADPKLWPTPTAEQAAKFLQEQASPIWRTCPNCGKLTGVLRKLDDPQVIVCPKCRTAWTLDATNGDDIARD